MRMSQINISFVKGVVKTMNKITSLFSIEDELFTYIKIGKKFIQVNDIEDSPELKANLLEDWPELKNKTDEIIIKRVKRYKSIVDMIKKKYGSRCQVEGCHFTFKKSNGGLYSEAHHLTPLYENGSQNEENVVLLCPNHHRMFHYADISIKERLKNKLEVTINGTTNYIIYR